MNEYLEDEDGKDGYVISDLRLDRFKDMMWEINRGCQDEELLKCIYQ